MPNIHLHVCAHINNRVMAFNVQLLQNTKSCNKMTWNETFTSMSRINFILENEY